MNRIFFAGYLGADARLVHNNEKSFIAFAIAESGQERPVWAECTKSVKRGETPAIMEYLTKGRKVIVTGRAYSKLFNRDSGSPVAQLGIFVDEIDLC